MQFFIASTTGSTFSDNVVGQSSCKNHQQRMSSKLTALLTVQSSNHLRCMKPHKSREKLPNPNLDCHSSQWFGDPNVGNPASSATSPSARVSTFSWQILDLLGQHEGPQAAALVGLSFEHHIQHRVDSWLGFSLKNVQYFKNSQICLYLHLQSQPVFWVLV